MRLSAMLLFAATGAGAALAADSKDRPAGATAACRGTVYLTLDTGNMRHADLIARILARHDVRATFFVANELTPDGDGALDARWAPYWRRLVAAGHAFGSHTLDHVLYRDDGAGRITARAQFGAAAGRREPWSAEATCAQIDAADRKFRDLTGQALDRLWRVPSGRAPQAVFDAAAGCGWRHAGWTGNGFLGDELPSDRFPNSALLAQASRRIGDGEVLMAHLGIRSRVDPYAPMLDQLIPALRARGLCFATLREHPGFKAPVSVPIPLPGGRPASAVGIGPASGRVGPDRAGPDDGGRAGAALIEGRGPKP